MIEFLQGFILGFGIMFAIFIMLLFLGERERIRQETIDMPTLEKK